VQGPPAGSQVLLGAASFVLEGDVVKPEEAPAAPAATAPAAPAAKKAG
jgi:HlyD family secretion protein